MEKLLHGQTKSSRNFIWEGEILTFGTCTEVLEYFENGSIKEYKNGNIKINKYKYKYGNIYENGSMKWKYLMNI
jgi:hypothetical protein